MTFAVGDYYDLVRLLEEHPEWRADLRRLLLTDEILELPQLVHDLATRITELAEAQKRSEERLGRLEAAVAELAEAQKRSEERLGRLEAAVGRLEAVVAELAEAQKRTTDRLDRMDERFGVSVEEEAADEVRVALEKKSYRATGREFNLRLNGDVDVVLPLRDPQGQLVWAVVEAKVRLGWRAVEAWANRMREPEFRAALEVAGVPGPYLVYAYGMRIESSAEAAAVKFGIGLVGSRGEIVAPAAAQGRAQK